MDIATVVIPFIPVPAQIIRIGASAVFGRAFPTTRKGSIIFASILFHHNTIAINIPTNVPINNPNSVSKTDMPI